MLEADRFLGEKIKLKVSKEYFRRLKSNLNGGNLVQGVNTWAVSVLRYSIAFFSWRKCELQVLDRKASKLLVNCLKYMEGCTQSLMLIDFVYLEKIEGEV